MVKIDKNQIKLDIIILDWNVSLTISLFILEFVKEVSTRSILINKGKLIEEGTPEKVTDDFIKMELE